MVAGLKHKIYWFIFILVGILGLEKWEENPALHFSERRSNSCVRSARFHPAVSLIC